MELKYIEIIKFRYLLGNKIDEAENSKDEFEVIEKMLNTVVSILNFYCLKIKTTDKTSIFNAIIVPTGVRFKLKFIILV